MQEVTLDIWWIVALGTIALLATTVGLIAIVVASKQKELITKKRQLEELAISESKYRSLFEQSPAGMLRLTTDQWNVVDANHALLVMFGVNTIDGVKTVLDSLSASDRQYLSARLAEDGSVEDFKTLLKRANGSEFWISFSASIHIQESFTEAVLIDITERRKAEDTIREQALLLDQAQDAILVIDLNRMVRYWNKGAERMYGFTPLEVVGRDAMMYLCGKDSTYEYDQANAIVMQHGEWAGELHQKNREGRALITDCRWTLVRNPAGEPAGILQVCTDVTERKRLESRFLRAQRVESIGIFASGIAHDLSNTLAPVLVGVDVLKRRLLDSQSKRLLKAIESSAKYGSEMIYQVLSFVKGVAGIHKKVNPLKLVKDVTGLLNHLIPPEITVRTKISNTFLPILGDATQLHQVLINLCANARDAMPKGGTLTFFAENTFVTKEMALEYPDAAEGPYVVFGVIDTGVGIPETEIHKIFEPFYTTKELGKGTGLGLSISMGIIKGHKGFLTVESTEGKGSTFRMFLPIATEAQLAIQDGDALHEYYRCLFYVAASQNKYSHPLVEGLEDYGYEPVLVIGLSQLREMFLHQKGKVHIVILEGFAGGEIPEIVKTVLDFEPHARVIALTEKRFLDDITKGEKSDQPLVLTLPVSVESLVAKVEQCSPHRTVSA